MKRNTKLIGASTVVVSLLIPTIAQASLPMTRQTQDAVTLYDNGTDIRAFNRAFANSLEGYQRIEALEGEIDSSLLRTTSSRFTCEVPKNPYCDGTSFNPYCDGASKEQTVFPDQNYAKQWVGSCFDERTAFEIELDLATAMENTGATRGFYQFRDQVDVRRPSDKTQTEERSIYYTIILDKNNTPGEGYKSGVVISDSEYRTNLYLVYENSDTVDLLDGAVTSPNAGDMIVYEMDGSTPETSNLTEIETFQNENFDTERLVEPTANFKFETDGIKNVMGYATMLKDSYNPDVMVIDYHNPISLKECAVDTDGSCLPETHSEPDPYFKPKLNVFTTDRTFFRNVCTSEGVTYTQENKIQADINSYVERYVITRDDNISDNMTNDDLLALNRIAPYKLEYNDIVEVDFYNSHSGFAYNTDISYFDDKVTEYLGKNASSPNNTLSPTCSGSSTYDDENCYDTWNGLHHDHYKKPLPTVKDISIVDVNYEEKVKVADAYSYRNSDGDLINVPAKYEWQKKNTCNTTSGTRIYNVSDFCSSSSNIKCLSVDTK